MDSREGRSPFLPIGFGDTFQLVLFLDSVRVRRTLGGIDKLIGETLSNGLDVPEGGFAGADGKEGNSLVDTTKRRDIDSLSSNSSLRTDTSAIFTGAGVNNGVNEDLDGVLVGQKVDDFESVGDDADGEELLAVVAALHHHRVNQTFDNGHLGLLEPPLGITASGMGDPDGVANLNVVGQGDVLNFDILRIPSTKKLDDAVSADF